MMNALGMISSCTGNLTEIKFLNRIVVTREKKKKKKIDLWASFPLTTQKDPSEDLTIRIKLIAVVIKSGLLYISPFVHFARDTLLSKVKRTTQCLGDLFIRPPSLPLQERLVDYFSSLNISIFKTIIVGITSNSSLSGCSALVIYRT